jgi:hypothetical protein
MADKYSLTLRNHSTNPSWVFAMYTNAPITDSSRLFAMAWQTKTVNKGNTVTFSWELSYTLMFASQGFKDNVKWVETNQVPANPNTWDQNAALLDFQGGDYTFDLEPQVHPAAADKLFIDTTTTVPPYSANNGPSVALAITTGDGVAKPAIGGTSGPNLHHTFTLHPSYFIQAGDAEEGQMADLNTLNNMQEVTFVAGSHAADWTLNEQNIWVPTNSMVLAGV